MNKFDLFELNKTYDFHDSSINELTYNLSSSCIEINISLCNWKQKEYKKKEPEICDIVLIFNHIRFFSVKGDDFIMNDLEINDVEVLALNNDYILKFKTFSEDYRKFIEILISAENITVKK